MSDIESPRWDSPALPTTAGCQCAGCRARKSNVHHRNHAAVYHGCLCTHDGEGVWRDCPSCPYHGVPNAQAWREVPLADVERADG